MFCTICRKIQVFSTYRGSNPSKHWTSAPEQPMRTAMLVHPHMRGFGYFCGRMVLIIRHADCPGVRHSQNVQPFTGLLVIAIAAADGVS